MTDQPRTNYRDADGIFNGIPADEEKLLAVGVYPKKGPGFVPLVIELTAHRPLPGSSVAMYAVRAYRVDAPDGVRPRPLAFGMDRAEIRRCWRGVVGGELGDATMEGVI